MVAADLGSLVKHSKTDMKPEINCPICGTRNQLSNIKYENLYWPDIEFLNSLDIIGCQSCGFGYTWPEVQDHLVNEFYKSEYRRAGSVFNIDFNTIFLKPAHLDKRAVAQILLAKQYTDFNSGDLFIELGPGGGGAFNAAEHLLPNPKIVGIELNDGAKNAFKRVYGVEIFSSVQEVISKGYLGKICLLSHSLEHFKLSWLSAVIHDFRGLIAPGGVLVIEVPLVDIRIHAGYRCWVSPHFLFFSIESIKLFFEKNNWEVLFVESCAPLYKEWEIIRAKEESNEHIRMNNITSNLKVCAKKFLSLLPRFLIHKIKKIFFSHPIDFTDQEFSYGGDRTCLRVVVRPPIRHSRVNF